MITISDPSNVFININFSIVTFFSSPFFQVMGCKKGTTENHKLTPKF